MEELEKTYNPTAVEGKIYDLWLKNKSFKPEVNPDGKPFCIIMPPPNANGSLHIGHAVFVTLEDLMIRYARMHGKSTLWLPGADHAGFETQVVFEKKLEKEGRSRFQMSREDLYKETYNFTLKNKVIMENQLRKLGASCDWDRELFTLDPRVVKLVNKTFKKLYDDGLAYRYLRLINWCTKHQTSLSDLEVKNEECQGKIYYIKYGPITVATTRPETIFGDVAVAVNPTDKRYINLIGQEVPLPLTNRKIKIIADDAIDIKFGTGAVKITPSHDPLDFEIGKRNNLDMIQVINDRGRMVFPAESQVLKDVVKLLDEKKINESREIVVSLLDKQGLLDEKYGKIKDDHIHVVGKCYKCGTVIEPLPREQWFVKLQDKGNSGKALAPNALEAIESGKIKIIPERFKKVAVQWLKNFRDWNISRQIVWGIQIPAWYCEDCKEVTVTDGKKPEKCVKCGSKDLVQDPDVFDTWFSSGQWPFIALQAQKSEKTDEQSDFEKFYPTNVMETAADILPFWVLRMSMLGIYMTGEVPFKNVYLHGLVRDQDRQKISKSKGNVVDPLGIAEQYGTDAVRMALVFGTSAGSDTMISEDKIRGMRNFANKIWNISRFVLSNTKENPKTGAKIKPVTEKDEWILSELEKTKKTVTKFLESYRFSQAGEAIYEFSWHKLADIYLESAKKQFEDDKLRVSTEQVLLEVLSATLTMLHPFMPFITEEIWSKLPDRDGLLITSNWV